MKNIVLLRHAKSSWKDASLDDSDRPLNKRGKLDSRKMADRFCKRGIIIDLIISSTSKRTMDTIKIFIKSFDYKPKIIFDDSLYLADKEQILKVLTSLDEQYKNVMIVGHNPGITNTANLLSEFSIENIPTTGIIGFLYEGNWKDIKEKKCTFLFFDYPKKKDSII
ncbi:MAG TPA: phosphohistidine phosphatase [Ignavibacteriales bacterium]|nr:phosphohistidine phosphatase [Ignavibacteriales bacterium]